MFFDDPRVAFRNVARAMRPSARLMLMVWQVHDSNVWAVSIDRALGQPRGQSVHGPDPILARRASDGSPRVGFTAVTLTAVDVPVFYGRDVDAALD
jgi:hypothetical protein